MLPLADLQRAIRNTSLGGDPQPLMDVIVRDGFSHSERLNIHRNNTTILLCEALGATFRVVKQLVGEEFFDSAATLYVRAQPPRSPCLFEYGQSFPDFLASLPSAAGLPYLSDVALLEWQWNAAFHARDVKPLSSEDLAAIAPEEYEHLSFEPHPTLRLVSSDFPIKEIWDINQPDADPEASVNLDEGGQSLVVLRAQNRVEMIELSAGGFALIDQLASGAKLLDAFLAAQNTQPQFDPAPTLAILISAGAFQSHALKP